MSELNDLITKLCPDGVPYKKLNEVLNYEQPSKYLVSSKNYSDEYSTPVLTAGKTFILGYTDEINGIYQASKDNPVIIFDDFTTDFKWVDFPFKAKSSGMKMLTPIDSNMCCFRYVYYAMSVINFVPSEHKRHWISQYSNFAIPLPPLPVQEEIVRILDSFTELEAELEAELADRKKQYEYYRDHLLDKKNLEHMDGKPVEMRKLNEVFDSFNGMGGVSNKWADDGNCQFIDYKNVYDNTKVDVSNTPYATVKKISNQRVIKQGDILCTCASEVPNECALSAVVEDDIRDNIFLDDHLFGLRVKEEYADLIDTTFINYYFTIFNHRKNVFKAVRGVTRYYIDTKAFMKIPIPVPSLATQKRVVDILDRFDTLTTSLTDGIPAEIAMRREQYEYYRSRLLDFPRLPDGSVSDGDGE